MLGILEGERVRRENEWHLRRGRDVSSAPEMKFTFLRESSGNDFAEQLNYARLLKARKNNGREVRTLRNARQGISERTRE